jgi:hypothetical protein
MSRDEWVLAAIVLGFALFITAHVVLVIGLAGRAPRWRAALAAVVLPLAPYWGLRERMIGRSILWVASACAYVAARWVGRG